MTADRIPVNRGNIPLRKWWKESKVDIRPLCEKAGIGVAHFRHVAAGRRAMSPLVARVFIEASGGILQLEELVYTPGSAPKPVKPRGRRPRAAAQPQAVQA
jgi:hypothetical protein